MFQAERGDKLALIFLFGGIGPSQSGEARFCEEISPPLTTMSSWKLPPKGLPPQRVNADLM
jgi:hypothetical protein